MRRWSLRCSQVPRLSRPYSDPGKLSECWCRWKSLHSAEVARSRSLPPSALQLPCEVPPVGGPGWWFVRCALVLPLLCFLCFLLPFLSPFSFGRVFAVGTCVAIVVARRSLRHGVVAIGAIVGLVVHVCCLLRDCTCCGHCAMVNCCGWCVRCGCAVAV